MRLICSLPEALQRTPQEHEDALGTKGVATEHGAGRRAYARHAVVIGRQPLCLRQRGQAAQEDRLAEEVHRLVLGALAGHGAARRT